MNISLPQEIEEQLQAKVAAGEYASLDEAVRKGVKLLLAFDRLLQHGDQDWNALIDEGIRSADAGDSWMQRNLSAL